MKILRENEAEIVDGLGRSRQSTESEATITNKKS